MQITDESRARLMSEAGQNGLTESGSAFTHSQPAHISVDSTSFREALITVSLVTPTGSIAVFLSSSSIRLVAGSRIRVEASVPIRHGHLIPKDKVLEIETTIEGFAPIIAAESANGNVELSFDDLQREPGSVGLLRVKAAQYEVNWPYLAVATETALCPKQSASRIAVRPEILRRCLNLVRPFATRSEANPRLETISISDASATAASIPVARYVESAALAGVSLRVDRKDSKLLVQLLGRFSREAHLSVSESMQTIQSEHLSCMFALTQYEPLRVAKRDVSHAIEIEGADLLRSLRRILSQRKLGTIGSSSFHEDVRITLERDSKVLLFSTAVNGGTAYVDCDVLAFSQEDEAKDSVDAALTRLGLAKLSLSGKSPITVSVGPAAVLFYEPSDDLQISTLVSVRRS